jgi:hypothetical protein
MKTTFWLRLVLAVGAVAVLAGIAIVAFRLFSGPSSQVMLLPGGVRVDYLGVSRSGESFSTDPSWQKTLRRILPPVLASKLPQAFSSSVMYGKTNTIAVWYTLTDAVGANVNSYPWQWYLAMGDDGFIYPMNGGSGSSTIGARVYHHTDLLAYPRRQKDFELRFLDGQYQTVGSIRVPNPNQGPFPVWQPDPLPIFRTNDGMVVKLERLDEGGRDVSRWVNARWKIVSAEPAWQKAKPAHQLYEDATGNQGGRLAFTESAWKLSLPFHRNGWTNFNEAEKFLISGLKMPAGGESQWLDTNFTCAGVSISLLALAAPGTLSITNGTNYGFSATGQNSGWGTTSDGRITVEKISSAQPFFYLETTKPQEGDEVRFRIIGSGGVELKSSSNGWHGSQKGGRRYKQVFDVTDEVDTISLEVIVSRPRVFEFFVNPAEVQRITNTNK